MSQVLGKKPVVQNKIWMTGPVLDQGQTPHCVGYAGAQWLQTEEATWTEHSLPSGVTGDVLYYDCKAVDGEPKAEDGSTGRSLMKVMQSLGYLASFHWATSSTDIIAWLSTKGPVLVGTPWTQNMFTPDKNGYIHPRGAVAGGHEWIVHGVFPDKRGNAMLKMCNSWGVSWGAAGHAYIKASDLWALIQRGGDAVGAIRTNKYA